MLRHGRPSHSLKLRVQVSLTLSPLEAMLSWLQTFLAFQFWSCFQMQFLSMTRSLQRVILKKTKQNKKFFFPQTQRYSLLYRTNYFPDLTLNTFELSLKVRSAVNCSGLCHHWGYSKEDTRGSKSYFMGKVKQNQTLWAVAAWLEVGRKVSSPAGTVGGGLDASNTLAG